MLPAIIGASAGLGALVGGYRVGDAGLPGSIYENHILSYADDFRTLDLVSARNPRGKHFTSRGCYSSNGGRRYPLTGPLAVAHDVSPDYTGPLDSNRGVPLNFDSHTLVNGEDGTPSAIRLLAIRQSAEEQAKLNTGVAGQIERAAMMAFLGAIVWNGPCIIEYRMRLPVGPAGQHPSVWNLQAQPQNATVVTGNEYGAEGNGSIINAYINQWNAGSNTAGPITQLGTPNPRDGNWRTLTNVLAADYKWYLDGSLKQSGGVPGNLGNKCESGIISNHVYNANYAGQTYSAAAWLAAVSGVGMEIDWIRVWRPVTGVHYRPLVDIPDVLLATESAALNLVLPSQQELWGATGLTEWVDCIPNEVEEPGGSNTASYDQFPGSISYTSGTRTVAGGMPTKSGLLHMKCVVSQDGVTCEPARFRVYVAPIWRGGNSFSFPVGVPVNIDIYSLWDVGVLFLEGDNRKGLAVSSLPAGLTLNGVTGRLTGTPTGASIISPTFSASNCRGQTTNQQVLIVVYDPAAGVPAPALTGTPTLLASWDYTNATTMLQNSGLETLFGADGTSVAITQPTQSKRPTVETRGGKLCARFTSAQQQFLSALSTLGAVAAQGVTLAVVVEPASTGASQCAADLSNPASTGAFNRLNVTGGTASGWGARKASSGGQQDANVGSTFTAKKRLLIAVFKATTAGCSMTIDGTSTPVNSGAGQAWPTGLTTYSSGCRQVSGGQDLYLDGWKTREFWYAGELNATQQEELAAYCAANFGTDNNA